MTLEEQIAQATSGNDEVRPIKVDLGNGQVLSFNNNEELSQNLREALAGVNSKVTELRQQLAELQNRDEPPVSRYADNDEPITRTNNEFKMEKFVELMRDNKVVEAFDYVDNYRKSKYEPTIKELQDMKEEYEAEKFRQRHPEFPGGQYADTLNKIREDLKLPFNSVGLEAAYAHAVTNQQMPDFKTQMALQAQQMQFANWLQSQGIQIPGANNQQSQQTQVGVPTITRQQASVNNSTLEQIDNMSLEQIEKILKQNNML